MSTCISTACTLHEASESREQSKSNQIDSLSLASFAFRVTRSNEKTAFSLLTSEWRICEFICPILGDTKHDIWLLASAHTDSSIEKKCCHFFTQLNVATFIFLSSCCALVVIFSLAKVYSILPLPPRDNVCPVFCWKLTQLLPQRKRGKFDDIETSKNGTRLHF